MSEKPKECILCKYSSANQKEELKCLSIDCGGTVFSFLYQRPNTKASHSIITKRHTEDLRTMTMQEWNDVLPVCKKSIKKIEERYKPAGYWFWIAVGEKAGQDFCPAAHSLIYFLPKYVKNYGNVSIPWSSKSDLPLPSPEKIEEFKAALQPNSDKVVAEKSRIVAKLETKTESIITTFREHPLGVVRIFTKNHLPNDIQALDQETWNQIGEMLQELMAKVKANTDCRDFTISIRAGKEANKWWKEEAELPPNCDYPDERELVVNLFPRYGTKRWYKLENRPIIGSMENERVAFKLTDYEKYKRIFKKEKEDKNKNSTIKSQNTNLQEKTKSNSATSTETLARQISPFWLIPAVLLGASLTGLVVWWLKLSNQN